MSWFPRTIALGLAAVIALALAVPVLCQLVAILFLPMVVFFLLVIVGRIVWFYTQ